MTAWGTLSFVLGITTLWDVDQLNPRQQIAVALHHPPRVSVLLYRYVRDAILVETTQPCQISARSEITARSELAKSSCCVEKEGG